LVLIYFGCLDIGDTVSIVVLPSEALPFENWVTLRNTLDRTLLLFLRPRFSMIFDFEKQKKLMAIMQVTERPAFHLSYLRQSFGRFGMVDPKIRISTGDTPTSILRIEESAAEFGIFDIAYR